MHLLQRFCAPSRLRQAFIIACEEELGVAVRDEILDEAIPSDDDIEVVHLALLVRNRLPKKRRIGVKLS